MLPGPVGSIRLFKAIGITVYIHWSWFLLAAFAVQFRPGGMTAADTLVLFVSVFAIVTMHEYGHALACRSVGGQASRIVLWPLGGVAYVNPPARPGALLWSIVAGPLVNLVLAGVFFAMILGIQSQGGTPHPLIEWLFGINVALFVFNMMPIYPLDGGQTLQAVLWFFIGRTRSLHVTAIIGLVVGILAAAAMLLIKRDLWLFAIALFIVWRSWQGLKLAKLMARYERAGIPIDEPTGASRRDWNPPGQ